MTLPWYLNPWAEVRRLQNWTRSREESSLNLTREAWDTRVEMLKLRDENAELKRKITENGNVPNETETLCGCQHCTDARPGFRGWDQPGWRYACELCGNKRCPHHDWHGFTCTGSNEPDQMGEPLKVEYPHFKHNPNRNTDEVLKRTGTTDRT